MKLIELVGNDLDIPKLEFFDFEDFKEKQENPSIKYLTYRKNLEEGVVRENALETLNTTAGILSGVFPYRGNIKNLKNKIKENKEQFENLKFWNYHIPWKKSTDSGVEFVADIGSLVCGGLGYLINPFLAGGFFLSIQGINEAGRRMLKKSSIEGLQKLENSFSTYNNFKSNIENAKIEIYFPSEAQEAIKEVENSRFGFDKESVNNYLKEIYSKY